MEIRRQAKNAELSLNIRRMERHHLLIFWRAQLVRIGKASDQFSRSVAVHRLKFLVATNSTETNIDPVLLMPEFG